MPSEQKLFSESDERIHIDLRDSRGYTKEIEKLSRNDSKLVLKVELKNQLLIKIRLRVWGFLGAMAVPIAAQVGMQLVSGLVNKIFGGGQNRKIQFKRRKRTQPCYR